MESSRAALAAVTAVLALAAVLCVPPSEGVSAVAEIEGGSQYSSLLAAVSAAEDGDTILLLADDSSVSSISVGKSLTIDGQGHSFRGRFVLDSAGGESITGYTLEISDLVMAGSAGPLVGGSPSTSAVRSVALALTGCSFSSSASVLVSVSNCSSLTVEDCTFASSGESAISVAVAGVECTDVTISGCTFTGTCSGPVVSVSQSSATSTVPAGTIGSLEVTGCDFSAVEADLDILVGSGTDYSSAFDASVTASSSTDVELQTGSGTVEAVLSSGARMSSDSTLSEDSYAWGVSLMGSVSLTGTPGNSVTVCAVGKVAISDFTGTVWFDASHTYGVSSEASDSAWGITVETVGMVLGGATGSARIVFTGSFVVSDDLEVGGTATVSQGSVLTVNSAARLTGGDITNLGTIEVYGTMSNDVDNTSGTINAHSGSTISGTITGNAVVNPIPATVTTVLNATAGQVFSFTISAETGTTVTSYEGPSWLTMSDGVLSGTPTEAGSYDVTVTAASAEYTVTLQYRIVVTEAESGSGWTSAMTLSLVVAILAIVIVAAIVLRWFGRI